MQDQIIFRLPNEQSFHQWFGEVKEYDQTELQMLLEQDGFIIIPFDGEKIYVLHPKEKQLISNIYSHFLELPAFINKASEVNITKPNYIALIEKTIKKIQDTHLEKIVISRDYHSDKPAELNISHVLAELNQTYKESLVACLSSNLFGLWLGSSPEVLLKKSNHHWETAAVAGTKKNDSSTDWGTKEIVEHRKVMDYIEDILKQNELDFSSTQLSTIKMGHLQHLYVKYTSKQHSDISNVSLAKLVNQLTPTPAVCGFPKAEAKAFILENEHYNRQLYTGCWGPIINGEIHLYVNLRCCKITNNEITYFAGGGINAMSDPLSEWNETEEKIKLLKSIIEN